MTTTDSDVYYDPYDFEIDADPYPVWRRLRDEQPLYYNERLRLLRPEPLRRRRARLCSTGRPTSRPRAPSSSSSRPTSRCRRDRSSSRTPRCTTSTAACCPASSRPGRSTHSSPRCREFCARSLDPLVGSGGFDFIADLGASRCPCAPSACCSASPSRTRRRSATASTTGCALEDGTMPDAGHATTRRRQPQLRRLHRLAGRPPLRRPHDRAPPGRVRGRDGHRPAADPRRAPDLRQPDGRAGNETTTRLIGWTGKVLADHPDQRAELVDGPVARPQRHRGAPALRVAVTGAGPLRDRGRRASRPDGAGRQHHAPHQRLGQPRRAPASPTATASTSTATSTATCPSATASTSAWARRWPGSRARRPRRGAQRFPTWEVDWDNAVQARTSTVRGWERLPVLMS